MVHGIPLETFGKNVSSIYTHAKRLYFVNVWCTWGFTSIEHLFSQNPATNTENSAQSRSEDIFMELTLFVYNINSQYFCIKSGLNYLRYKRYDRNETEGHIFFCNLNFDRNGIYILYINCYHHRKIYILH